MTRTASVTRTTGETAIELSVDLDGTGVYAISTGSGFFDHMLRALAPLPHRHGRARGGRHLG